MHIFYTPDINSENYILSKEESGHCVKVLRLNNGDKISLIDGRGTLYKAKITNANPKKCEVTCIEKLEDYGKRNFHLHIAMAPTKSMDRTEWMLEKCTEMGIDEITMLNCRYSERKVIKEERLQKVVVSAVKQSLKAYMPVLHGMTDFKKIVESCGEKYKFIAHCNEGDKNRLDEIYIENEDVVILIGPEGDFSKEEVKFAMEHGFKAITLGTSRLRTETAAIAACHTINMINKVC